MWRAISSSMIARSLMPRDALCSGCISGRARSARAPCRRAGRARRADRRGRRHADRDPDTPRSNRPGARPIAVRACRRRPPHRLAALQSAVQEALPNHGKRAVSWMTRSLASMLPATEKPSPAIAPAQSTHFAPVCCPTRPTVSMTWSWRCSRPSSGAVRRSTTSGAAMPARRARAPYAHRAG